MANIDAKFVLVVIVHGRIEGRETQKSSYYPWKMVSIVLLVFWAQQNGFQNNKLQRMKLP